MGSRVRLEFVKMHQWFGSVGFYVFHGAPGMVWAEEQVTASPVRLWGPQEHVGFGSGYFGERSFGWGQSGKSGEFGSGRFGVGEFGYCNAIVEWESPAVYEDGLHLFGIMLAGKYGELGGIEKEVEVMVMSRPREPGGLTLESFAEGRARVRIVGDQDAGE